MKCGFEALTLKKLVDALSALVDEVNFQCSIDGVRVDAMDATHVSLLSLRLPACGFESYECENHLVAGVSLGALKKVLRSVSAKDTVHIHMVGDSDTYDLVIDTDGNSKRAVYAMKLFDVDEESLAVPEGLEYAAVAKMSAADLWAVVKDLAVIGDTVDITVAPGSVSFATAGDIGRAEITLRDVETAANIAQSFSLRYIVSFIEARALASDVTLYLSQDFPLRASFDIGNGRTLDYFLAPKIDDFEDDDV